MSLTDVLAQIGAVTGVTGTIAGFAALGWDYYKWKKSKKPQLRVTVNGNMISTNNLDKQTYITVRVANAGDKPIKITMISYRFYKEKPKNFRKIKPDEMGFFNLFDSKLVSEGLPYRIDVGDEWNCFLIQTAEIEKKSKEGFFYICAENSLTENNYDVAKALLVLEN